MGMFVRTALVVGLTLAVPAAVWVYGMVERPASTRAATAPTPTPPQPGSSSLPVGSAGCSAAACHGGSPALSLTSPPGPTCWQTSATHWMAVDPHTKAYAALEGELARKMMAHLHGANPDGSPKLAATHDKRCLACHTNPALLRTFEEVSSSLPPEKVAEFARELALRPEGVGCEACHGNASKWYGPHTTWNPGNRAAEYGPHGMTRLYDIGERALMCAGCHVGAPADEKRGYLVPRDMNHDMIAAGHPRLNFDFADYQRRLPPHWQEKDRLSAAQTPRGPAFEVKGWLVGRVAVAEAACRLTEDRATRLNPWPEFAEFNCYACHHELVPDGWRPKLEGYYGKRPPGAAPWQTIWPVTRTSDLKLLGDGMNPAATAVDDLIAAMEGRGSRKWTVAEKAAAAKNAAEALKRLRDDLSEMPDDYAARSMVKLFAGLKDPKAVLDWDTAGQAYLGAAAFERARIGLNPAAKESPAFRPAFDRLKFPVRVKTGDAEEAFNSPHGQKPPATRESVQGVLDAVTDWPR